jgi:hypothetical protein
MPMGKDMGGDKEPDSSDKGEESEDGLREAFDEFKSALDEKDDDAAFEALKNFTSMCAMKEYK